MAKTKVELQNYQGESLSPITIASNVLYEDGRNAQEVFEEYSNETFTPTIENSGSMFKVGQGDNVDYSSNIVNGAYESMVLKGKTMVNCIQEPSSKDVVLPYEFEEGRYVTINDTKESGALGVELKGQTLVNLLAYNVVSKSSNSTFVKEGDTIVYGSTVETAWSQVNLGFAQQLKPLTKYLIKWDSVAWNNESFVPSSSFISLRDMKTNTGYSTWVNGQNYMIGTTPEDTSNMALRVHATVGNSLINTITIKGLKVLEYQQGMENWDIPFFEGMASCKMPTLHTVGKNLIPLKEDWVQGQIMNGGGISVNSYALRTKSKIKVKPNTKYTFSRKSSDCKIAYHEWEANGKYIKDSGWITAFPYTFTTNNKAEYINLTTRRVSNVDSTVDNLDDTLIWQLEESSTATTYEPHKSSILSLPEEVVLRSLPNGVCDTFNTRTGVYTQRIGDDTFTGTSNENWIIPNNYTTGDTLPFRIKKPTMQGNGSVIPTDIICDKMKIETPRNAWGNDSYDKEGLSHGTGKGEGVDVRILKSKLTTHDVAGFKAWLSQNPIRVQYQLHTPIVTKINLSSILKSWNTTTHIYSEIPENTLYPTLSHSNPTYPVILKPSTKYSIVANSYSNNHTNSTINFNLGGATASTTVGNRVTTITTPSTLSNELLTMSGRGNKLNNVMVIEGDVVGDEPYFEGICDCKSPILSNVGKNLINIKKAERRGSTKCSLINNGDGSITLVGDGDGSGEGIITTSCYAYLEEGKTYTFSFESDGQYSGINGSDTVEAFLLKDGSASIRVIRMNDFTTTFTCQDDGDYYVRFDVNKNNTTHKFWNIQLTEGATVYPYEPYKSNILSFNQKDDKTIVLRSLPNGVCDTLNVETGEYVQRIGEVVLDGSDNSEIVYTYNGDIATNTVRWYVKINSNPIKNVADESNVNNAICDKLVYAQIYPDNRDYEAFFVANSNNRLFFRTEKSKLSSLDIAGIKRYLSQNPITVQYELATPIVTTIDVQGFPYAYTNGYVQLSSGSIEQSLTPTVEYSVATNRNGQIRTNQKMVEKHQQHLDQLQAMIISNMVNTQYQQTLTTLNYDLLKKEVGE